MVRLLYMLVIFIFGFFGFLYANTIGNIDLKFCGTGINMDNKSLTKELTLNIDQDQEENICMVITNSSLEDIFLKIGFVDGAITNDNAQNKACRNEGDIKNFGQFISMEDDAFQIKGGQSLHKYAKIKFPEGYAGKTLGCVTYYIDKNGLQNIDGSALKILVRKASFINAIVSGDLNLDFGMIDFEDSKIDKKHKNLSNNKKIKVYKNINAEEFSLDIGFYNNGSVPQNIYVTGYITNIFGHKEQFNFIDRQVLPKDKVVLSHNVVNLPFYKGFFDVEIDVTHYPIFDFESDNITEEIKKIKYISQNAYFLAINRYLVGLIILIILLFIIRRRIRSRIRRRIKKTEIKKIIKHKKRYKNNI